QISRSQLRSLYPEHTQDHDPILSEDEWKPEPLPDQREGTRGDDPADGDPATPDGVEEGTHGGGAGGGAEPTELAGVYQDTLGALEAVPHLLGEGAGLGSNSWVVSGEHTASGKPLLANDPHLGLSQPGIWLQAGLHCRQITAECPFDVTGFTF